MKKINDGAVISHCILLDKNFTIEPNVILRDTFNMEFYRISFLENGIFPTRLWGFCVLGYLNVAIGNS